jgi:hypothetical protein
VVRTEPQSSVSHREHKPSHRRGGLRLAAKRWPGRTRFSDDSLCVALSTTALASSLLPPLDAEVDVTGRIWKRWKVLSGDISVKPAYSTVTRLLYQHAAAVEFGSEIHPDLACESPQSPSGSICKIWTRLMRPAVDLRQSALISLFTVQVPRKVSGNKASKFQRLNPKNLT